MAFSLEIGREPILISLCAISGELIPVLRTTNARYAG